MVHCDALKEQTAIVQDDHAVRWVRLERQTVLCPGDLIGRRVCLDEAVDNAAQTERQILYERRIGDARRKVYVQVGGLHFGHTDAVEHLAGENAGVLGGDRMDL